MIRIVGVQRSPDPQREFVLLQNQGNLRISVRGHMVIGDVAIRESDLSRHAHVFSEEELVPPGMYVLLATGAGVPRWSRTKDGALVFYAYMHRDRSVWEGHPGAIHVLSTHHTFVERGPALTLR